MTTTMRHPIRDAIAAGIFHVVPDVFPIGRQWARLVGTSCYARRTGTDGVVVRVRTVDRIGNGVRTTVATYRSDGAYSYLVTHIRTAWDAR